MPSDVSALLRAYKVAGDDAPSRAVLLDFAEEIGLRDLSVALTKASDRYYAATGEWSGADWDHDIVVGPGPDDIETCSGGLEGCPECAAAEKDAETAEEYAEGALTALFDGEWDRARDLSSQASRLEFRWGDSPTWGGFETAVEQVVEIVEGLDEED